MQIKDSSEESQVPVIICTNQILSEEEASVMRANSWLYHYYMVQSRLQLGMAYGAHSPAHLAAYYPHMLSGAPPQHQPASYAYDPHHHAYAAAASAGAASAIAGVPGFSYPGYHALYSPATPHYHAHLAPGSEHLARGQEAGLKIPQEPHGPLDFSKSEFSRTAEYNNSSQQSSPSLRSDTSSSPVYHPPHESLYGPAPDVAVLTQGGRHASISDHHYKAHHSRLSTPETTISRVSAPNPISGFWTESQVSGFEKYKPELDLEVERKRVKKEAGDFYNSDSNNNSDSGPTYYSLDQLHLQHHS